MSQSKNALSAAFSAVTTVFNTLDTSVALAGTVVGTGLRSANNYADSVEVRTAEHKSKTVDETLLTSMERKAELKQRSAAIKAKIAAMSVEDEE